MGVAGREGGKGASAESATIIVRVWVCWSCQFRNWPSRLNCRVCGAARQGTENRMEDRWTASRIPPGCVADAMPNGIGRMGVAGRRGPGPSGGGGGVGHQPQPTIRRVPGLGPMPTGRKVLPMSASGLPGGGGRTAPAGEGQPQRRQGGVAGKGDNGTGVGRSGKGGAMGIDEARERTKQDEASDADDASTTWAKVVRGPRGRRSVVHEGSGTGDKGERAGGGQAPGDEDTSEAEDDLPPQRVFVAPGEPRESILRKAEAAAARAKRAKERGAKGEKVRQAEAAAEEWAKRLREAGGASPTTLLFQIRGEEKKKQSSVRAIERLERRISEEEEEILKKRAEIQKLHRAVERHASRLEASERRLAYLAAQKHGESIALDKVSQLRAAAALLASQRVEAYSPILEHLAEFLPQELHEMEEGDTTGSPSASGGSGTEEEMDVDGPSREIDWQHYEGRYAEQLRGAREELRAAKAVMLEAAEAARESKKDTGKRPLGSDEPKEGDREGDIGMVPALTPEQAEDFHRNRVRAAANEYRHLQAMAAKELVECGTGGAQRPQPQPQESKGADSSTPGRGSGEAEVRHSDRGEGGSRGRIQCIDQWRTAEERDAELGRGRERGRPRGRSAQPRGGRDRGGMGCGR